MTSADVPPPPHDSLVPRWQKLVAGAGGVMGAIAIGAQAGVIKNPVVLIPIVGLLVAAVVVHLPHLGAQLLARAAWWSNLVLAAVLGLLGNRGEGRAGIFLAIGCGGALLVAGRRALAEATAHGRYRPVAFKATLQLVMVLALADAQMLLLMGVVEMDRHDSPSGPILLAAVAALVVGFVGLYRLALWGVLLTVGTSALLAILQLTRAVRTDSDFRLPILVMAMLQVAVATPMLLSLVTGRPLPSLSAGARAKATTLVIAAIMLVAIVSGLDWSPSD